jgi:transcriptional regulatory protein LevR
MFAVLTLLTLAVVILLMLFYTYHELQNSLQSLTKNNDRLAVITYINLKIALINQFSMCSIYDRSTSM